MGNHSGSAQGPRVEKTSKNNGALSPPNKLSHWMMDDRFIHTRLAGWGRTGWVSLGQFSQLGWCRGGLGLWAQGRVLCTSPHMDF